MDLVSLVLTLRPQQPPESGRPMPVWWGRAAHALFLRTIQARDPALAGQLHDENGPRPFTVSNLLGHFKRNTPQPDQTYTLRFTTLTAPLSEHLLHAALPGGPLAPGAEIQLDFMPFTVEAATAGDHPWSGHAAYAALAANCLPTANPPRHITFHLASPTGFRTNGRIATLPTPGLFFGSLLERWNTFAPLAFPAELRRYADECLVTGRFELHSRAVPLKEGGLRFGAQGQVAYTAAHYDRYWMSLVYALSEFAFFSGVGAAAAMGMGQCRRIDAQAGRHQPQIHADAHR